MNAEYKIKHCPQVTEKSVIENTVRDSNLTVSKIFTDAVARWCSVKNVFLKSSQNSQKAPVPESLFKQNFLLKKWWWYWYFPVNLTKFFRTLFLRKNSGRLLLNFGSLYLKLIFKTKKLIFKTFSNVKGLSQKGTKLKQKQPWYFYFDSQKKFTAWIVSVFGFFQVGIFHHLDWVSGPNQRSKHRQMQTRKFPNTDTFYIMVSIENVKMLFGILP